MCVHVSMHIAVKVNTDLPFLDPGILLIPACLPAPIIANNKITTAYYIDVIRLYIAQHQKIRIKFNSS